jgi:hypothetical protein
MLTLKRGQMLSAIKLTDKAMLGVASLQCGTLRTLGVAKSSLGDAKSSLGDAESSLGDAKSSVGDAKSSLGAVYQVPRVQIFELVCEPQLVCTVSHAEVLGAPCVRIESRQCLLRGSPFIESLSRCYDFHVVTHFTWSPPTAPSDDGATPYSGAPPRAVLTSYLSTFLPRSYSEEKVANRN